MLRAFELSNWHNFLQKKCIRKCLEEYKPSNMPSKIPEELADEENDPDRANPTTHRPTFSPPLVSSVCFIFNNLYLTFRPLR